MKATKIIPLVTLTLILLGFAGSASFAYGHQHKTINPKSSSLALHFDTPTKYPFSGNRCEIKATSLFTHLTPTFQLFRTQQTFYRFEFFNITLCDSNKPLLPIALHSFYQNLFCSIISPNAP